MSFPLRYSLPNSSSQLDVKSVIEQHTLVVADYLGNGVKFPIDWLDWIDGCPQRLAKITSFRSITVLTIIPNL